ncbi:hydrogenase maturation protease [bacterium]|jgi:hydrogenase maturation protease|nr:hydrogenase maturation protease [bacterium]MBT3580986.1 hydrogenase maturation protease [bacterium]MBT4551992.1 hydrogenase maturation protease [bacterium]MBT5988438.1 hydrogenase maturation protease [bacterium]MBT7087769.1 hydrogenase maturation protease [bacterium]
MSNSNNKVLIIGVGNPYRKDDGIGPYIIKLLQTQKEIEADLLDGGTDGLTLIDYIKEYTQVILIDAVNMGKPAGEIVCFSPAEVQLKIKNDSLSTHGFGLAEVLKLVKELDIKTKIQIIGIQPQDISFGEGLSKVINDKISEVIKIIKKTLEMRLKCVMPYQLK